MAHWLQPAGSIFAERGLSIAHRSTRIGELIMNRRELLQQSAIFSVAAIAGRAMSADAAATPAAEPQGGQPAPPLNPPAKGSIPVAFVLANDAVVIDFAGPWEVFQDVRISGRDEPAFSLYTVAESKEPITTSGGMKILPNYSFDTAPAPKVIVIPAQQDPTKALLNWIRASSKTTDVTMSVCTGAFVLAATGLLAGRSATTHHSAYRELAMDNPDIKVKRGARFVEDGRFASSGGLSSGIDLALHVVERYYGRDIAKQTAFQMEYQGQGWLDAASNRVYAEARPADGKVLCPICSMEVDPKSAVTSVYQGQTYYFCMPPHKARFDAAPAKWLEA
jgi:putative intracellular protease/amidase/YHS domain-containing protein